MDTRFWGPSGWRLLHMIVATPLKNRNELTIKRFFELLPYVLPCKFCRHSLSSYYEKRPIPGKFADLEKWLYHIHNDVNDKLRSQNLIKEENPTYAEVHNRYSEWSKTPCASTQILGWDFLFSVANTTPGKRLNSSPMPNAPELLDTVELRNKWNTMTHEERIPYIKEWWKILPLVLPFTPWIKSWQKSEQINKAAPLEKGKKAVIEWLYNMERSICKFMSEDAPHNSFTGLCKEISAFSSGCGSKTSAKVKTCRAKKDSARNTLRNIRMKRFSHNAVL